MAGWFSSMAARLLTKAGGGAVGAHPFYGPTVAAEAQWTPRRYDRLADEGFAKNVIVHRCIDEIAKGVSQAPLLLYQRDADGFRREVHDHPVAALLRQPNPQQSRSRFVYELAAALAIGGNAYVEGVGPVTGPRAGKFTELWGKRPDRMTVLPRGAGVAGYRYDAYGETREWWLDPVTLRCPVKHIKLFHPLSDHYGLSPIEVAAMDIDTHNRTREWNKSLLDNAARPEGALTTEKALTDGQFARLRGEVAQRYSGARNAGRPMVLENGLQWQQFSFSPRDMDFLNSRHTTARDLCAAFGVPPMLLGIPGDNTFSNQREARMAFFDVTVVFYLALICQEIGAWLLPDGEAAGLELGYDLDAVPAMALRREQLFERAGKATFLTINEARDMAGFGKLPDGDVLLVPNTVRPLEQTLAEPEPAVPDAAAKEPAPGKPAAKPPKTPAKPAAADPPKRAANDKAGRAGLPRGPALVATLKAARAELGMSPVQFTLWLVGEGVGDDEAAEMAALTGEPEA